MKGHECYHCRQWVADGTPHDCWTTTEAALTRDLPEDLREAWERLRESAAELGEQRIYASHKSIMFSRRSCYAFVRPRKTFLELCIFLGRAVNTPPVSAASMLPRPRSTHTSSRSRIEISGSPITDWMLEAFEFAAGTAATRPRTTRKAPRRTSTRKPHR